MHRIFHIPTAQYVDIYKIKFESRFLCVFEKDSEILNKNRYFLLTFSSIEEVIEGIKKIDEDNFYFRNSETGWIRLEFNQNEFEIIETE